jgi:hypothetical protein
MANIEDLFKNADFSKETNFKKELKKQLDSWIDKLEENQINTSNEYLLSDDELDLAVAAGNPNISDKDEQKL